MTSVCPYCGYKNRPGVLFCEECGKNLQAEANATLPTRKIDEGAKDLAAKATWGTARFNPASSIIIHVRDSAEPIILQPTKRTVVGRSDSSSTQKPDLDLTPYGALEKGVSRLHAAIERSEDTLTLIDMGSSNGTHLNGQRLIPDQPRVLRDGDEIRFGKLVAHVYFK
ncbi:MAG: FHA domain-containing protein [Chloroflexi bacterium]|nr:FHA domain-containing protein [Chloroflexota bacterium]